MATQGTSTGLSGQPRDPRAGARARRGSQRLAGTALVAKDGGVIVNAQGQLDTSPAVVFQQLAAYEAANGLVGRL